jgi:putative SOS response-associated peptidase YedK
MCNLYRLDASAATIAGIFDATQGVDPWDGGYVAPGKFAPVITGPVTENLRARMMPARWGFAPPPNATGNRLVTNVRNLESPFWIGTLKHPELRCLIPVTRFQEWSGEVGAKRQHWFDVPSQPVFSFAGIWRDDGEMRSFAMLTTEPNSLIEAVHPKAMPLILHPEDHAVWLSADWKQAQRLVEPYPSQLMGEVLTYGTSGNRPPRA